MAVIDKLLRCRMIRRDSLRGNAIPLGRIPAMEEIDEFNTRALYNYRLMTQKLMLRSALSVIGLLLAVCWCTSAQESATIAVPEVIKAGEVLNFTIWLDKAPSFDDGNIQFTV